MSLQAPILDQTPHLTPSGRVKYIEIRSHTYNAISLIRFYVLIKYQTLAAAIF